MPYGYGHKTYHNDSTATDKRGNRVKAYHTNDMVVHIWANQSQDFARTSNGNLFFRGPNLYSYGTEFVVGIVMPDNVTLINGESSTPSTGRHQSRALRAARWPAHALPYLTDQDAKWLWDWHGMTASARKAHPGIALALRKLCAACALGGQEDGGAYIYALISRGDWQVFAARTRGLAAKAEANQAAKALAAIRVDAKTRAARPKADAIAQYRDWMHDDRWEAKGQFSDEVAALYACHRAEKSKARKRILWSQLKLARDYAARAPKGDDLRKVAASIARLRLWQECSIDGVVTADRLAGSTFWHNLAGEYGRVISTGTGVRVALKARLMACEIQAAAIASALRIREDDARRIAAALGEEERRAAWLAGVSVARFYANDGDGGVLLRALSPRVENCRVISGTLETSQGATVPLAHAFEVYRLAKLCRARGKGWTRGENDRAEIRAGHFRLDWIDESGNFRAACHMVNWPEIDRLAVKLGVSDCPANG